MHLSTRNRFFKLYDAGSKEMMWYLYLLLSLDESWFDIEICCCSELRDVLKAITFMILMIFLRKQELLAILEWHRCEEIVSRPSFLLWLFTLLWWLPDVEHSKVKAMWCANFADHKSWVGVQILLLYSHEVCIRPPKQSKKNIPAHHLFQAHPQRPTKLPLMVLSPTASTAGLKCTTTQERKSPQKPPPLLNPTTSWQQARKVAMLSSRVPSSKSTSDMVSPKGYISLFCNSTTTQIGSSLCKKSMLIELGTTIVVTAKIRINAILPLT